MGETNPELKPTDEPIIVNPPTVQHPSSGGVPTHYIIEFRRPHWAQRLSEIPLSTWLRSLLALAALVALGWLLSAAGSAVTPFFIGLILFYLLAPVVNRLNKYMPRPMAILLVYVVVFGALTWAIIFIVPLLLAQVQRLIASIPSIDSLQTTFNNLLQQYRETVPESVKTAVDQGLRNALQTIEANISQYVQTVLSFVLTQALQVVGIISFVVGLLIIPIWLFYILNDQRKAHLALNRMLNFRIRPDFWNVIGIVDGSLSAYIRGQITLGAIIGVAVGFGLFIIDLIPGLEIDYILLLALWAGVCELVPMIGAILGGTPGVILAFTIGGPTTGIVVLIMYVVIQQLENNILVPRIIGESVGVHPAVLTVTLIVLGQLFGLPGVVLAAPATAIARDLYRYTWRRLSGYAPDDAAIGTAAAKTTKS